MAAAEAPPRPLRQVERDAEQRADGTSVLPLTEICIKALVQYKRFLGNVGYVEPTHLSRVLAHCTRSELETIEDLTWEGSRRDLTWSTWHLWHRIYKTNYGQPNPEQLLPLPGEPPLDYAPPTGLDYTPADYRGMLQQREEELTARKAAAADKLRANYKAENSKRLAHGVEYTTKLPPPKRAKANSPAVQLQKQLAAANASRTLGGKPAGKVMQALGLAKLGKARGTSSVRPGMASQQRSRMLGLGGRNAAAAPAQQAQPSALACLARKKPAAAPAPATQQQQQGSKFSIAQVGSAGVQRSPVAAAAAAADPHQRQVGSPGAKQQQPQRQQLQGQPGKLHQGQLQQQQQCRSSLGLLNTPLRLQSGKQGRPNQL